MQTADANERKIRLLIVSYLFPPNGGIAVQRALSLAKYLPGAGFEVHILKGRNAAGPADDPALLKHVPASVTIHDAFTPEIPFQVRQKMWKYLGRSGSGSGGGSAPAPAGKTGGGWKAWVQQCARRILCPEPEILWVPFGLRVARRIVRRHAIDAVMVTAPPFSAFLVGTRLKREFPHLKFISDFRDEWLTFYLKEFDFQNSSQTRRRAEEIERETVEMSDLVVAVTESSLAEIRNRYPEEPDGKFTCVFNGYDPEVVRPLKPKAPDPARVIVGHIGTVYRTASPRYYLDALDSLPDAIRSRFETRFIGRISEEERVWFENRKSVVRMLGFLPQAQAMERAAETDYLLLTMTNDISLPGKLFEYLAMGRPLLALSPGNGEVNRILERTGAGWCVDFQDAGAIRRMLERAAEGGAALEPRWDEIRKFERPRLTELYGQKIRALFQDAPAARAPGLR